VLLWNAGYVVIELRVVVPIRQAQPRLRDEHGVDARSLRILSDRDGQRYANTDLRGTRERRRQIAHAGDPVDGGQLRGRWPHAERLDARGIHEAAIVVADFPLDRAGR